MHFRTTVYLLQDEEDVMPENKFEGALIQKPRTITKREPEPPLPIPFELPRNFTHDVQDQLKKPQRGKVNL